MYSRSVDKAAGSTKEKEVGRLCEGDWETPRLTYLDLILKEKEEFAKENELQGQ